MIIDFTKLDFIFSSKPLLIGGKAMEYYGLRKAGDDIDFIITENDYKRLLKKYQDQQKDLWGDLGISVFNFEMWNTVLAFSYSDLSINAIEKEDFLIISLEKLLLMKVLGMKDPKYNKGSKSDTCPSSC